MNNDQKYLDFAMQQSFASKDKSSKVGATIVSGPGNMIGPDWILGEACNGFPLGVVDQADRHTRPAKYWFTEHAERNAIFAAVRDGNSLMGATLYYASLMPGFPPCCDCARAIIQSGISRVVGKTGDLDDSLWRPDWKDSMIAAREMLYEAGVIFDTIDLPPHLQVMYDERRAAIKAFFPKEPG